MDDQKKRVLVIDNEPDICAIIKMFLDQNYKVTTVTDSHDALELLRLVRFDAIVTDLHMPGHGGYDILRHVQENNLDTKVILCTGGLPTDKDVIATIEQGFAGVLLKPFNPSDIVGVLKKVADA